MVSSSCPTATFFYKIVNKEVPDYLFELAPPLVATNVNYNLSNSHNIHVPFNRLSVYQNSYFPCILTPLTMVYRTHRHGILTPYSWYFYPPTMVYRPSYPCYFDPLSLVYRSPTHGILNSLDLTIRNLPLCTFSSFKLTLQRIFYTKR